MKDATVTLLRRLLAAGGVPRSQASGNVQREMEPLLQSGAVAIEKSGSGSRFVAMDPAAVESIVRRYRPEDAPDSGLSPRAAAIRRSRDSKRAVSDTPHIVLLRAVEDDATFVSPGKILDVAELTRSYGVAALAVQTNDEWSTPQPLALVENQEVFFHFDRLPASRDCGCVLYYAGHVSTRLHEWLCARPRAPQLLFCPDYDPVGLVEYLRLRRRLADTVRLLVPDGFEELLRTYGKPALLADQRRYLAGLRADGEPKVQKLLDLMQKHGAGLEQEILLENAADSVPHK